MADAQAAILADLERLRASFRPRLAAAPTEQALRDENAKILGKKGELALILRELGKLDPDSRKMIGANANVLKAEVERAFDEALAALSRKRRQAELDAPPFDLTLPGREPVPRGHAHPISIVRDEIVGIFEAMGFAVFDGPEIDTAANNFDKLGFPPDHPATDMHDTFYVGGLPGPLAPSALHPLGGSPGGSPREGGSAPLSPPPSKIVLRTHTSNIQVRAMSTQKPPFAYIAPGACYRVDSDLTHSPMFHQVEAFLVDEHVSLSHLKGVLAEFAERFYGAGTPVRLRPSYFPFVEPGAEVDVGCVFCKRPDGTRAGCAVCKHSGWLEVLGCGMIHPVVFEACGIDSEKWTGFALGMGIERQAMLRYGIPEIRLLFENDPRFLSQF